MQKVGFNEQISYNIPSNKIVEELHNLFEIHQDLIASAYYLIKQ